MKTIIAGTRDATDYSLIEESVKQSGFLITEVVSGCARGIDTLGEQWAQNNGIPVKRFPADWNRFKKSAGPIRNQQMAEYSEALIAIPSPTSRGTVDMINRARKLNLKVFIYATDKRN